MHHVCYLDRRTDAYGNFETGRKTLVIRGMKYKTAPYECVFPGDILHFSHGRNNIVLSAVVEAVHNINSPNASALAEILETYKEAQMLEPVRNKRMRMYKYFVILILGPVRRVVSIEMDQVIHEEEGFWMIAGDYVEKNG